MSGSKARPLLDHISHLIISNLIQNQSRDTQTLILRLLWDESLLKFPLKNTQLKISGDPFLKQEDQSAPNSIPQIGKPGRMVSFGI